MFFVNFLLAVSGEATSGQNALNFWAIIAGTAITTGGLVAVAWINIRGNRKVDDVKTDTFHINKAVNDVAPGEPTMRQEIKIVKKDQEAIKATAVLADDKYTELFAAIDAKIDKFMSTVDDLMELHLEETKFHKTQAADIAAIREVVDNRKNSFTNPSE